ALNPEKLKSVIHYFARDEQFCLFGSTTKKRLIVLRSFVPTESAVHAIPFVEYQIRHRLGNRVRDLRIIVRQEGMILQGHASTFYAKQLAQHAAMELAELPILANDIEVK